VKATTKDEALPLRGIYKCHHCGNNLTGSASKGKSGRGYYYYHCNHCKQLRVRADYANLVIENVLREIELTQNAERVFEKIMKKYFNGSAAERARKKEIHSKQLAETEKRIKNLEELFLDRSLSIEEFRSLKDSLDKDKKKQRDEIIKLEEDRSSVDQKIKNAIKLSKGIRELYLSLDVHGKSKLLCSIFPERLEIENGKCRTPSLHPALLLVLRCAKGSENKKAGNLTDNLQISRRVEPEGVEPSSNQGSRKVSTCLFAN